MEQKRLTLEQSYALIIMTTHKMGYDVTMLNEAEDVIKNGKRIDPCSAGWFEKSALAAHEVIRVQGLDAVVKANSICDELKKEYL